MVVDDGVAERIRRRRTERGVSQAQAAGPGVSKSYLSLIESGRRRATRAALRTLADTLDTTVEYLETGRESARSAAEEQVIFAELALHNGAPEKALEGFSTALGAPDTPRTVSQRAALGRAQALEYLGRASEAACEYDELWRAAEPGTMRWAELAMNIVRCYVAANDVDYATEVGQRALAVFDELGLDWSDESVRLGVTLAGAHLRRGDVLRAETLLRRLITIAERMDSPLARGSAYWNAARVASSRGRSDDALRLAGRAVALIGETDHQRNVARMWLVYGGLLANDAQRLGEARSVLVEARARMAATAGVVELRACVNELARVELVAGDIDRAEQYVAEARELPTGESVGTLAVTGVRHAQVLLARGRSTDARRALAAAADVLTGAPHDFDHVDIWRDIAETWEALGESGQAMATYRTALDLATHPRPRAATGHPATSHR